ncbi:MAG: hypothetical protein NVS2B9_03280 [Myxococcales bacterium]
MKLYVRHAGGELAVPDLKEFLLLWNRGVIAADDLVRREGIDRWVKAADLPWIRGAREGDRKDDRRLLWLTVGLMVLGLCAVLWVQRHPARVVAKSAQPARSGVQFRAP